MGLSNRERRNGIYDVVLTITETARELVPSRDPNDPITLLKNVCSDREMWHSFLGSHTNVTHWLFGSEAGSVVTSDSVGPWGVAIHKKMMHWFHSDEDQAPFNVFDYFLSIHGLLKHVNVNAGNVFKIFSAAESLSYYLRRYDDDMRAKLVHLDRSLSEIMGLCYGIFRSDQNYAMAYLIHETCEIIYGGSVYMYRDDWVSKWLDSTNMHHHLNYRMKFHNRDFDIVANLHKSLTTRWIENNRDYNIFYERIIAALILAGGSFNYQFKHDQLFVLCKKNGLSDDQINTIKGYSRKCIRLYLAADHRKRDRDSCRELSIHEG